MTTTRLRQIRKARRLTLQQLAEQVGTTAQTIQRLETGNMTVSVDWLERIGAALQLTPAQLLDATPLTPVKYVGRLNGAGRIEAEANDNDLKVGVSHHDAFAIRLGHAIGAHPMGNVIVAGRVGDREREAEHLAGRECIVSLRDGRITLTEAASDGNGRIRHVALPQKAAISGSDIDWVAVVLMSARFV
jgi:transcriptional regulator with XRE-family HTH domain